MKTYLLVLIALLSFNFPALAAESMTLTTYYPAPNGHYKRFSVSDKATLGTLEVKGVTGSFGVPAPSVINGGVLLNNGATINGGTTINDNATINSNATINGNMTLTPNAAGVGGEITTEKINAKNTVKIGTDASGNGTLRFDTATGTLQVMEGGAWKTLSSTGTIPDVSCPTGKVLKSITAGVPECVDSLSGGSGVFLGIDSGNTTRCPGNSGGFTGNQVCNDMGLHCTRTMRGEAHTCTKVWDCSMYGGPTNTDPDGPASIFCKN